MRWTLIIAVLVLSTASADAGKRRDRAEHRFTRDIQSSIEISRLRSGHRTSHIELDNTLMRYRLFSSPSSGLNHVPCCR
jgi:hypothetical protein